ncbi:HAD family hydrolase [Nocardioides sp. YIM 152315]|uniref:HAD family hydrolase n=1 Tax=Nocardioides sp. YIM 152315 TaxID=3031760 RepID=UPI0023DABF38|nr:HAD family hydrolase [Nocardioides sp. YIM 152315]MDF1606246.1 HAD family hydrolase [Nocardioides sp. YIM 152315]
MDTSTAAVLLDIDGTLVDSTYHHAVAWHRAFARHNVTLPMVRIHRAIGMGGDRLVAHVADQATEDRLGDQLRDAWREEYLTLRHEVRPLPGARELVGTLRTQGFRVGLASSGDPQFSREAVDLLGVGDDIELLTTSEDVDSSKPDPDLVGETLARLGGIEQAVLVGDTVYDVESAARAGLACVALGSGGVSRAELLEAGSPMVADLPEDLLGVDWPVYLSSVTPPAP